jgi:hypothetical protein
VGDHTWEERRESERVPASELPHLSARLEGGREVRLIDLSRRGVQFETPERLRPGTEAALRFVVDGQHFTVTGRVVRSLVSALDGSQLVYRTALSFPADIAVYGRSAASGEPARRAAADPPAAAADGLRHLLSANDW